MAPHTYDERLLTFLSDEVRARSGITSHATSAITLNQPRRREQLPFAAAHHLDCSDPMLLKGCHCTLDVSVATTICRGVESITTELVVWLARSCWGRLERKQQHGVVFLLFLLSVETFCHGSFGLGLVVGYLVLGTVLVMDVGGVGGLLLLAWHRTIAPSTTFPRRRLAVDGTQVKATLQISDHDFE